MKYVVILGDGMADLPVTELSGKTPLECAKKPNIDALAKKGEVGLVKTIPEGMPPGSDTANLSVMGYDITKYYTGRSPIEAVSMGLKLEDTDVTFRCNLVTLSDDENYADKIMIDYSSDEISSEEAAVLIEYLNGYFKSESICYYPGKSYRHCMVWANGPVLFELTPPHDILDKKIGDYLPKGEQSKILLDMMEKSHELLKSHPLNLKRVQRGQKPANSIWLWGEGKKLTLPSFYDKYGISGSVVSAVDLIKGIGICAGLKSVEVEGATGNINTNFKGKAVAALNELKNGADFVYIHIEAPDECGHRFEIENKIKSIELIDELVVGTVIDGLKGYDEYSLLVLPDHPTPLSTRTHSKDPVPYILYRNKREINSGVESYTERSAEKTEIYIGKGYTLMDRFIKGE